KREHPRYLHRVNQASAIVLREAGVIEAAECAAILRGLAAIAAEVDPAALTYTGEHEDYFFVVDAELRRRVGADAAGRLHTGRSRNDIDHTIFKIALRDRLLDYLGELLRLTETLIAVADRHRETIVLAYTHGQPAQPTTFGHYLGALIEVLQRDCGRLLHAYATVDLCSLGAAAITTSGFGLDRARLAALLGFGAAQENAYGAISACDYITEPYAMLKVHLLNLGRFAQDLGFWTAFEVGQLRLPDGLVQISSVMPQKRNPVPVEHLRLLASLAAGRCETVLGTLHNTPFTDINDAESEVQEAGYEAFATAGRALRLLRGVVDAAEIDEVKVRGHIEASCATITELADSLVRAERITSREGHTIASRLAAHVIGAGGSLAGLEFGVFAREFAAVAGRPTRLGAGELRRFVTPEHFVAVRGMFGGPAALGESLARYRVRLAEQGREIERLRAQVAAGGRLLEAAVSAAVESV
ncbi:MAG: argininosuccinate lyase, partial [Acetobacteraceae bacterium]|nr:argininosuccinate lyase [Acetobacteraceae bacterium]